MKLFEHFVNISRHNVQLKNYDERFFPRNALKTFKKEEKQNK